MRHIFRCLVLALASLSIAACSIGEGNGIVNIRIVALDGSTDFKLRSDQCEGLLLGVIATFTDGQQLFYSSRSKFSLVSGEGTVTELKNSSGFVTSAELVPTVGAAAGGTVVVKATYLSLEAEQEFTYSDVTIDSFQLEPARVALIAGESQNINPVLALSDGSRLTGLVRALDFELDDETEFTLGGFTSNGQQILNTTATNGPATVTATYCKRTVGSEIPVTINAINHAGSDATLEIRSNFNGKGPKAADANAVDLPNGIGTTVSAHLKLPNNIERNVTLIATWSSSDTNNADCAVTGATCSARVTPLGGAITTDSTLTGDTNITATLDTIDGITLNADNPLKLEVSPVKYRKRAFALKDEANQEITINNNGPTISMASGTGRILKIVGRFKNAANAAYELVINAVFVSSATDKIIANNTTLAATGDQSDSNITINVDTSNSPAFQNNNITSIDSFQAEVHLDTPTGLIIDANSDNLKDSTFSAAAGDKIQLRSILQFAKGDIVRTGATAWTSSDSTAVAVTNISNAGQITVFTTAQTVITAKHKFVANDGTETLQTSTITIN